MPVLRNAEKAIIDERKIRDYVLNMSNPEGRHKARVIRAATGLTRLNYNNLIEQIRQAILVSEAEPIEPIPYGERFRVVITISGPKGMMRIRTGWIYRIGEDVPRLTTLYPYA
jgi:filamentous hemagglutinin